MTIIEKLADLLNEMAFTRMAFMTRIRENFIEGALGEFVKYKIAKHIGVGDADVWYRETKQILSKIPEFMDKQQHATTFKDKALQEAINDSFSAIHQITGARKELLNKKQFDPYEKEIRLYALTLKTQDLVQEMFAEFLPEYAHLVDEAITVHYG